MKDQKQAYKRAALWCGTVMLAGLASQHVVAASGAATATIPRLLALAAAAAFVLAIVASPRKHKTGDLLVSAPFVVTVLGLITLATIAGTLVLQRLQPAKFTALYGSAASAMRVLFLEDLFHSLWFSGLVLLTCLSLGVIALRRWPWRWGKLGYVCAHLGVVIIAAGALLGQLGGHKGRIDTEVGQVTNRMRSVDWRTGEATVAELPFAVRLDDFRIESHDPVFRVYVFQRTGEGDHSGAFKPVLALAPDTQKGKRVAVSEGHAIRIDDYATGDDKAQKTRHVVEIGGVAHEVEPGRAYPKVAGKHVTVGRFFPHFSYDIQNKQARNVSAEPINPALEVTVRDGDLTGAVLYQGWLFAKMPGFDMSHGAERSGPPPNYRFDGAGASGPRVSLTILAGEKEVTKGSLTLLKGQHFVNFADGRYVVVFRQRDTEAKNYYSTLSILKDGKVAETRQIFVNEPFSFGGYTFYQANFDPRNLRYSGIDVVRDPGLWLVIFGLVTMLFGVFQIFYFRTLGRRSREAQTCST